MTTRTWPVGVIATERGDLDSGKLRLYRHRADQAAGPDAGSGLEAQHVGALAHEVRGAAAVRQVAETGALDGGKIEFLGAGRRIDADDGVARRDEQVAGGELHAGRARTAVLQPEIPRQLLVLTRVGIDAPDDGPAAFEPEEGSRSSRRS